MNGRIIISSLATFFLLIILFLCSPTSSMATDYVIAPADVLEISIWGEQELTRQLVVRPDGKVSFPLIGDIAVAGKTTAELKNLVEDKIKALFEDKITHVLTHMDPYDDSGANEPE